MTELDASQFYTGLVAELYEPLMSQRARAEDYLPFLTRSGTPALELGCGSGLPLLDLRARGLDVDGLDASADMLELCRTQARARGLDVTLHHQPMQSMSLPRRYRSIFLAGATFTLLASDADARAALARMHEHLLPEGRVLIPLELTAGDPADVRAGDVREVRDGDGSRLRCRVLGARKGALDHLVHVRLRYEKQLADGTLHVLERDWTRCFWDQTTFAAMLRDAGFDSVRARDLGGNPAAPDAAFAVFTAQKHG